MKHDITDCLEEIFGVTVVVGVGAGGDGRYFCESCLSAKIDLRGIFEQITTMLKEASVLQNTGPQPVNQPCWSKVPGLETNRNRSNGNTFAFQTVSWPGATVKQRKIHPLPRPASK